MTFNQVKPIEWPQWWIPTDKRCFLEGMPFIGPHSRILREASLILKERNQEDVENCWVDYKAQIPAIVNRMKVFEISNRYLNWPNNLFIPLDMAPIVFGFIPGIWIEPIDIIDEIGLAFNINKAGVYDLLELAHKSTLINFFECLSKNLKK